MPTVDDGANHSANLSLLLSLSAGEAGGEGWCEVLLEGHGAHLADGRPAHGGAERLLDPTIEIGVSPSQFIVNWTQRVVGLPLQHCEICGRRIGEWREGGLVRKELLTARKESGRRSKRSVRD